MKVTSAALDNKRQATKVSIRLGLIITLLAFDRTRHKTKTKPKQFAAIFRAKLPLLHLDRFTTSQTKTQPPLFNEV